MGTPHSETRKRIRFTADPEQTARIDFGAGDKKAPPRMAALICNESFNGCCIISMRDARLVKGARFTVVVGELAPMQAEVRWVREIDEDTLKLGLEFLE